MTRRHQPQAYDGDGLTPEQRYQQERERAISQGKKIMPKQHENPMSEEQLAEAKQLLREQEERLAARRTGGRPKKRVDIDDE